MRMRNAAYEVDSLFRIPSTYNFRFQFLALAETGTIETKELICQCEEVQDGV